MGSGIAGLSHPVINRAAAVRIAPKTPIVFFMLFLLVMV
jgi:hypothetical protein